MAANYRIHRASAASGALASTLAPTVAFQILEIRLHLGGGAGANEAFTATLDSAAGANHDAVLVSQNTNAITDHVAVAQRVFGPGDEIDFALTNTNNRSWGLEVIWAPI